MGQDPEGTPQLSSLEILAITWQKKSEQHLAGYVDLDNKMKEL